MADKVSSSAARMWVAAAIGVACSLGEWTIAGMTVILTLIMIAPIRKLEKHAGTYDGENGLSREVG